MIDFTFPDITMLIGGVINEVPNATITFNTLHDSQITEVQYLPDGNPILPEQEFISVTLQCYLRQSSFQNAILDTPMGANLETNYFEGRLIVPKTYPFPLQAQGDIMATINGQVGRVVGHRAFSSPAARNFGYDPVMGQKIALFVQFQQGIAS